MRTGCCDWQPFRNCKALNKTRALFVHAYFWFRSTLFGQIHLCFQALFWGSSSFSPLKWKLKSQFVNRITDWKSMKLWGRRDVSKAQLDFAWKDRFVFGTIRRIFTCKLLPLNENVKLKLPCRSLKSFQRKYSLLHTCMRLLTFRHSGIILEGKNAKSGDALMNFHWIILISLQAGKKVKARAAKRFLHWVLTMC